MSRNPGKRHILRYIVTRYLQSYFRNRYFEKIGMPLQNKKTLDFGCGPGVFSGYLHENDITNLAYGYDISVESIIQAKELFPSIKNNFFSTTEDVIQNGPYDIVTAYYVYAYLPNKEEFFALLNDIVAPNGTVLLEVQNPKSIYNHFAKIKDTNWEITDEYNECFKLISRSNSPCDSFCFDFVHLTLRKILLKLLCSVFLQFIFRNSQHHYVLFKKKS